MALIAEDEVFFDANREDINLEKIIDKMIFLISAIDSLKPRFFADYQWSHKIDMTKLLTNMAKLKLPEKKTDLKVGD